MANYEVTVTGHVRVNNTAYEPGATLTVDDALLEELQKHDIVANVVEVEPKPKASTRTKKQPEPVEGA